MWYLSFQEMVRRSKFRTCSLVTVSWESKYDLTGKFWKWLKTTNDILTGNFIYSRRFHARQNCPQDIRKICSNLIMPPWTASNMHRIYKLEKEGNWKNDIVYNFELLQLRYRLICLCYTDTWLKELTIELH